MIVLNKTNSEDYGVFQVSPCEQFIPVQIKGGLWMLPDHAEQSAIGKNISFEKREVNKSEIIQAEL